jgi:cytochrome P450
MDILGHDTTANALGWTLWCLATHPECQNMARNEILAMAFGEKMDANDVNELRYLDRCLRESLRLFPPVPVLERDLEEDLWICDKLVPKGTMVVVSPFILHHREKARKDQKSLWGK